MIVRITGTVAEISEESAVIERDGIGYEVLLPGYAVVALAARNGQEVTLHTMQYFEGSAAGGNMIPRLIGFSEPVDRAFFRRFISVKGIGIRKGLKALAVPVGQVAVAIESGDAISLARLPGIGKRAAETIIAELRGKVEAFALGTAAETGGEAPTLAEPQRLAIQVLVEWGDSRPDAERYIQRVCQLHPALATVEDLVQAAFRVRSGSEG